MRAPISPGSTAKRTVAYTFRSPAVRDGLGSYHFKEYTSAEVDRPPGRIRATRESRQEMFHPEDDDPTLEDRTSDAEKHRNSAPKYEARPTAHRNACKVQCKCRDARQ